MLTLAALVLTVLPLADDEAPSTPEPSPREAVQRDAAAMLPTVESELARRFLKATQDLPSIDEPRVVFWHRAKRTALLPEAAAQLGEAELAEYTEYSLDEQFYYNTLYGSPVAYTRLLDILASHGFERADGKRLLDFGYGNVSHLRLLASIGAHAVGVDIDELLAACYREASDTGVIARSSAVTAGPDGSVKLVCGRFPATPEVIEAVGSGFDLVISKNVLKSGYIHPERTPDPPAQIELGVDDATFLAHMHRVLVPGGLFAIYNIYPKQVPPEEGYLTWATGDCPWSREALDAAGFEILSYNINDDEPTRAMARKLGWDEPPHSMNLKENTFATYTVLRRKP